MNTLLSIPTSVYIPSIVAPTGHNVDDEYIKYLFENIWVMGDVNRVDIFDVVNKNGKLAGGKRGAFVHMNNWANNSTTELILEEIMKTGQCCLWLTNNSNRGRGCYWVLKKMNREPVKETQLNVHQLAEKLREMEELLNDRDRQIQELLQWKDNVINGDIWDLTGLDNVNDSGIVSVDQLNTAFDYGDVDDSIMTVDELNCQIITEPETKNVFDNSTLDMNTRKLFTTHLCNN